MLTPWPVAQGTAWMKDWFVCGPPGLSLRAPCAGLAIRRGPRTRVTALCIVIATLLAAPPATGAPTDPGGGIRSDEFDSPFLETTVWEFVDPRGDSSLNLTGSHAVLSVPAGSSHDLWEGANHAPRLIQRVADTDFEIEAKFDDSPAERFEMQGVVVQQDGNNLIRLEVHSDGTGSRLFVASFVGGTPGVRQYSFIGPVAPGYLRVSRSGDWWTPPLLLGRCELDRRRELCTPNNRPVARPLRGECWLSAAGIRLAGRLLPGRERVGAAASSAGRVAAG